MLAVASCASINAKKHSYANALQSPTVKVNGADLAIQLKPEGTSGPSFALSAMVYSAAVATLDGPFRWRVVATGTPGSHESLIVHRIRTLTGKTRRDEWFPTAHLGQRVDFVRKSGQLGDVKATFPIPGLLQVKPREDGPLEIRVDLTVTKSGKPLRQTVKFHLQPSESRQDEFIFLPAEIIRSIGKSPEDWDDGF